MTLGRNPKATRRFQDWPRVSAQANEPFRPDQLSVFECVIDESAGMADEREYQPPRKTQMTELRGESWDDAFGDRA